MDDMTNGTNPNDDAVAALLRLAGRRPAVPDDAARRVREAVHEEWQEIARRRTRTRWLGAAAAAVVLVTSGALWMNRTIDVPTTARIPVATIQSIAHGRIFAGEPFETPATATASLLWGGATLRLDAGTRIRIDSDRALRLERGALYLDSAGRHGLVIHTPLGTVTDIGTQFEVRLTDDGLRLRVREGRADLQRNGATHTAVAGVEVAAGSSGVSERKIARSGAEWSWIVRAAPPLILEGHTLREVVDAACRENGLTPAYPAALGNPVLHGGMALAPDEALAAALAASGLTSHIEGDTLLVRKAR